MFGALCTACPGVAGGELPEQVDVNTVATVNALSGTQQAATAVLSESPKKATEPMIVPEVAEAPAKVETVLLRTTVVGGRALRGQGWALNTRSCYCQISSGGDTVQTRAVPNRLDVKWGEELQVQHVKGFGLELSVWDKPENGQELLIGKTTLAADKFELKGLNKEVRLGSEGQASIYLKICPAGGSYPPALSPIVQINCEKKEGQSLGLALDGADGKMGLIVSIDTTGPFAEENDRREPDERMVAGDFLVAVNGIKGEFGKLAAAGKSAGVVNLEFIKATYFRVFLERSPAEKPLGASFTCGPSSNGLLITAMSAGAMQDHSEVHKDTAIKAGDWICEVNGFRGPGSELFNRMKAPGLLELVVGRPAELP